MTNWEKAVEQFGLFTVNGSDLYSITVDRKIELEDPDGYRYYLAKENLSVVGRRGSVPARFFNLNPFTEYNIRNYLNAVLGGNVSLKSFNASNAHDLLDLYCISQDQSYRKSWNEVKNGRGRNVRLDSNYRNPKANKQISDIRDEWFKKFGVLVTGDIYERNCAPIKFICPKHEDFGEQEATYSTSQKAKYLCKYCAQESSTLILVNRGRENFYSKLDAQKNPDITVVGEYVSFHVKIACICQKCGAEFLLRPDHILRGIGCGKCTVSIGENRIKDALDSHGIQFIPQYFFDDCKMNNRVMPFDFFIPDLDTAIEFDGEQHFKPVDHFGGEENLEITQKRDRFKTDYCKRNNINLIRIPYTDINNIEQYIEPLKAALSLRQNAQPNGDFIAAN